jgi:hypothetical protein
MAISTSDSTYIARMLFSLAPVQSCIALMLSYIASMLSNFALV